MSKGSLIYELYPPDLVNAQHEYLLALNTANPLLLRRRGQAQIPAGTRRIRLRPSSGTRPGAGNHRIYAPSSGYVSELKVREGQYVEPAAALLTSAPSSRCG